jgi:hypothetical protein
MSSAIDSVLTGDGVLLAIIVEMATDGEAKCDQANDG